MAWNIRTSNSGLFYGEAQHDNYWSWLGDNSDYWAFDNCLANCTVYAIGRQYENGRPKPVTTMKNANKWHEVVNTDAGWTLLNYTKGMSLEAGDILEWADGGANHVAVVETDGTDPTITGSWWTDNNGGSSLKNRIAGSNMGSTMESASNFFKSYYTWRFWHNNRKIYNEAGMSSNLYPTYVLRYEGAEPGPTPPPTPTPTVTATDIAIYATINKRRNKRNVKIIL